ncbi:MAG: META domain-containing protein [Shewanella sp.]|nr:META domain-containing protein [Shewanella sp.]MCF1431988.1 META domain-containing protein [Shewanella sp.]MCF1439792.1 META domain-containing protein [Shewanella sp.]MCF1458298.1 META domain-containing protein [Shewanella sp.]
MNKKFFFAGILALGLTGCQSSPAQHDQQVNLIGDWKLEVIMGQPTVDYSPAQINFDKDGRLSGNNSCNNFFGTFTQEGNQLTLDPAGSTMKACVDSLMAQEQLVNQAMKLVQTAEMKGGKLELLDENGKLLLTLTKL